MTNNTDTTNIILHTIREVCTSSGFDSSEGLRNAAIAFLRKTSPEAAPMTRDEANKAFDGKTPLEVAECFAFGERYGEDGKPSNPCDDFFAFDYRGDVVSILEGDLPFYLAETVEAPDLARYILDNYSSEEISEMIEEA